MTKMYIPAMRERVEITGKLGPFMVVDLDLGVQQVNVISLASSPYLEEDVPFSALRPYKEEEPLESGEED